MPGGSRKRTYVFYGRRRMRGAKKLSPAKLADILETLKKPPRILIRYDMPIILRWLHILTTLAIWARLL